MERALAEQHFSNFEEVGKHLDEWFAAKDKQFFWHGLELVAGVVKSRVRILMPLKTHHVEGPRSTKSVGDQRPPVSVVGKLERSAGSGVVLVT
ncbi:hypothetical protein TNCV_3235101 [Trichonephila clavipes]|nr:hypothetical protein TNCV_3235101 [Trichonephila clavipes]